MERLQYIIEDSTIAELLGVQNFTNSESAILELVKNAYDAKALHLILEFEKDKLIITDDGIGMNNEDIKKHWMHVGKSFKGYETTDKNNCKRILAGSKGIGRFALCRLGESADVYSKEKHSTGICWSTDWNHSFLSEDASLRKTGTKIVIYKLRERWTQKKIEELILFLSKTYNDTSMNIDVIYSGNRKQIERYFPEAKVGINCLYHIKIYYKSNTHILHIEIFSDEFDDEAKNICKDINLEKYIIDINMLNELKSAKLWDLSEEELEKSLLLLGDFKADFYFNLSSKSSPKDMEKFHYKHSSLPENMKNDIILYRNAFSISSYEGEKDWLELGKRNRKSPAAASHATGTWRVRENQLSGKILIDKKENKFLQDLSNRQGLEENVYYELFIKIIHVGIEEFERYRQNIIRFIIKNKPSIKIINTKTVTNEFISNPNSISSFSPPKLKQFVAEIKAYKEESQEHEKEKKEIEKHYKYDVRILSVLSTTGLKATSIAHEMKNDRNTISSSTTNIIDALKKYDMWEELNMPDKTDKAYRNIPELLNSNRKVSKKILAFMDIMLSKIEKNQFEAKTQKIYDILKNIQQVWQKDYSWITISLQSDENIQFFVSEDIIQVVFDNLILNSVQQNENRNSLHITISAIVKESYLHFSYTDNGKGLDEKYISNTRRILEIEESTRKNGHGLGMWIVNNTIVMSGGEIQKIYEPPGFRMDFVIGGKV